VDDELFQDFIEESSDLLEETNAVLTELEERSVNSEDIDCLFRNIHTIKGASSMFEMNNTQETAHTLESYLGECKKEISKFDLSFVRSKVDIIEELLENGDKSDMDLDTPPPSTSDSSTKKEDPALKYQSRYFEDFMDMFLSLIQNDLDKGAQMFELEIASNELPKFKSLLDKYQIEILRENQGDDKKISLLLIVKKEFLSKAEGLINKLSKIKSFSPILKGHSENDKPAIPNITQEDLSTEKENSNNESKNPPAQGAPKSDVLRIPIEKVNSSLNNIWEIFLIRNQMAYLFEKNKPFFQNHVEIIQEWEILDNAFKRNISDLESTAMSMRMRMRMSNLCQLFARMKKTVRSYQQSVKKDIHFQVEGEEIELDKKVIDMLGEPLIHLVRNAMDHGLEENSEREKLDKSSTGNIILRASSSTDKVIIEIIDDGKGIDPHKILEKAKEKELPTDHIKSEDEMIELLFYPGFSTADQVTSVSGRGVGMDAVKRSITKLGGEIKIQTKVGKGSTFRIELPVSMSVVSAIIYEINGQKFASSINNVLEICRYQIDDKSYNNGEELIMFRGKYIPIVDLTNLINIKHGAPKEKQAPQDTYCVMNMNGNEVALKVDKVDSHSEIVVKEMEGAFPSIGYVGGVSILATGRPIFILALERVYKDYMTKKRVY
jgi:two-component system, chemotaxis family, sensor kinase CheA